jgi:hypothetical protein
VKAGFHPPKRREAISCYRTVKCILHFENTAYPRTTVFRTGDANEMIGMGSILWKRGFASWRGESQFEKNERVLYVWVATTLLHGMAGFCFHQTIDRRVIGQLASKSATLPDDEKMTNIGYRSDWRQSDGIWEQGLPINETNPPTQFPSSVCVFIKRPSSNVWYGINITKGGPLHISCVQNWPNCV